MTWMIATIDCRSALQRSGAVKVKVVQASPSENMIRQPMSDEKEIKKLLLEKDYNLTLTLQAIVDEADRRDDDLLHRYEKREIDSYMYCLESGGTFRDFKLSQEELVGLAFWQGYFYSQN